MFGKILVPIDGSTEAIAATRYVRKIAEKFSSAVTLIHIVQHAAYIESDSPSMSSSIITSLNERATQLVFSNYYCFFSQPDVISSHLETLISRKCRS
ncbi:MAG: hypothetical protein K0Q77_2032, partial [Anaerosporomusa subterranea]|nr:hypothetical protein [Anaerosporomusa subterranea]